MNTEKMIVKKLSDGKYINSLLAFCGTRDDAVKFAAGRNFGGGVECYDPKTKTFKKL